MGARIQRFFLRRREARNWFPLLASLGIFAYLGSVLVPVIYCYLTGKPTIAEVMRYLPERTNDGLTPTGATRVGETASGGGAGIGWGERFWMLARKCGNWGNSPSPIRTGLVNSAKLEGTAAAVLSR